MRWIFSFVIAIHGLVHVMGLVKALEAGVSDHVWTIAEIVALLDVA